MRFHHDDVCTLSAPASPACRGGAAYRPRRACRCSRGDRVRRRTLPVLSRRFRRHDDRQRHSSFAVGQSRRARLICANIGGADRLAGPAHAEFPFVDLASKERWTLRFNDGRLPFWIFDPQRRVPGTRALDYLSLARLSVRRAEQAGRRRHRLQGAVYKRLVEPLLLAALNIDPPHGSAKLAGAIVRETLAAGGLACRPLIARDGLGDVVRRAGAGYAGAARRRRCGSSISFARCNSPAGASRRSNSPARPSR